MKNFFELLKANETVNRFVSENGAQLKKIAVVAVLIVAVLAVFTIKSSTTTAVIDDVEETAATEETTDVLICVDIGGAVQTPMLAELPEGSRVEDAINAAGGITEKADLSSINRADFLEDGEKIYIPEKVALTSVQGESAGGGDASDNAAAAAASSSPAAGASADAGVTGGKVNINSADSTALQTLNGVGPATAQKIIDYRNSNGRFKSPEDIKNVSGIGDKTYEKLKDYITI